MSAATTALPEVGTTLPPLTCELTRETLVRYAGASGDFNPIHYSDHAAASLGLDGVIAHGMLTMGTAARVVTEWAGPEAALLSYFARFTRPVMVPADGAARLEVSGVVAAVEGSVVTVALEVTCNATKVLGAAKVVLDLGSRA